MAGIRAGLRAIAAVRCGAGGAMAKRLHIAAVIALLALIVLCVAWELFLAPLRPGGSWLVLKVLPLLLVLRGVLRADNYTLQWSTLLVWAYFTEGIVRAVSDAGVSAQLAALELLLSIVYFGCAVFYLRPLKKLSKLSKLSTGSSHSEPD